MQVSVIPNIPIIPANRKRYATENTTPTTLNLSGDEPASTTYSFPCTIAGNGELVVPPTTSVVSMLHSGDAARGDIQMPMKVGYMEPKKATSVTLMAHATLKLPISMCSSPCAPVRLDVCNVDVTINGTGSKNNNASTNNTSHLVQRLQAEVPHIPGKILNVLCMICMVIVITTQWCNTVVYASNRCYMLYCTGFVSKSLQQEYSSAARRLQGDYSANVRGYRVDQRYRLVRRVVYHVLKKIRLYYTAYLVEGDELGHKGVLQEDIRLQHTVDLEEEDGRDTFNATTVQPSLFNTNTHHQPNTPYYSTLDISDYQVEIIRETVIIRANTTTTPDGIDPIVDEVRSFIYDNSTNHKMLPNTRTYVSVNYTHNKRGEADKCWTDTRWKNCPYYIDIKFFPTFP